MRFYLIDDGSVNIWYEGTLEAAKQKAKDGTRDLMFTRISEIEIATDKANILRMLNLEWDKLESQQVRVFEFTQRGGLKEVT